MSRQVLDRLKSEEFQLALGFIATPSTLRRVLGRSSEVLAVRKALEENAITEDTLRAFVSSLVGEFRRGRQFLYELALAALAVTLESWPTDFAEEFLGDLARLRLAEMSLCIRVARECLKNRQNISRSTLKQFFCGAELPKVEVASWISGSDGRGRGSVTSTYAEAEVATCQS